MNDAPLSSIDGELETLPPRWAWARPLEIGEASLGKMLDRAKHTRGSAMPYLRNLNVRWGGFDLSDLLTMYFRDNELERYSIQQGDLLICEGGEPGRCAVWHRHDVCVKYQKALHRLRLHEGIEPHFVMYHLMDYAWQGNLERFFTGSTIKHFTGESLQRLRLKIAPANEQQRIVAKIDELFSELDAGVASLKRARALLKKYRQAVLKAAVTGELTCDWRERHKGQIEESGADLLRRILKARHEAWEATELKKLRAKGKPPKDDRWKHKYKEPRPPDTIELPSLPEGWLWVSLDQLLTGIEAGKNFRCEERPPAEHEVGVVKVSSVTWGVFNENESKTITDSRRVDRRYAIRPGDFLISRANTIELVGACVIAGEFRRNLLLSDKVLRFRFAQDLGRWVDICLRSKLGRSQIEALATGNQLSMRNISQPSIRRLVIPLPPLNEVEVAVDGLEAEQSKANEASAVIDQATRRSEALRQSILKAAFAGKLVPQDPNDEPASVLLERIRAECAGRPKPARGRRRKSEPRQLELLR